MMFGRYDADPRDPNFAETSISHPGLFPRDAYQDWGKRVNRTCNGAQGYWVAVKELKLSYWGNPIIDYIYPLW